MNSLTHDYPFWIYKFICQNANCQLGDKLAKKKPPDNMPPTKPIYNIQNSKADYEIKQKGEMNFQN